MFEEDIKLTVSENPQLQRETSKADYEGSRTTRDNRTHRYIIMHAPHTELPYAFAHYRIAT